MPSVFSNNISYELHQAPTKENGLTAVVQATLHSPNGSISDFGIAYPALTNSEDIQTIVQMARDESAKRLRAAEEFSSSRGFDSFAGSADVFSGVSNNYNKVNANTTSQPKQYKHRTDTAISEKQLSFLTGLAGDIQSLERECKKLHGKSAYELNSKEADALIQVLK